MKIASITALAFTCLVLLLGTGSYASADSRSPAISAPPLAGHVGEGVNHPL